MLNKNQFLDDNSGNTPQIPVGNFRITDCIGFTFTRKCNAKCSFCCNNSGPKGDFGLETQLILNCVNAAASFGFRQIGLSGGEPMMRYNDIFSIAERCQLHGMTFTLSTNGFWAKNKNKGLLILTKLKKLGLNLVRVSYDESHSEWIATSTIENLIDIGHLADVPVILSSAYFRQGPRISDLLSKEILERTRFHENPVILTGRATQEPKDNFEIAKRWPTRCCPSPLQITIDFDGGVYPCCSVSGFSKHLLLGNIKEDSLEDCIRRLLEKPLLLYAQHSGFSKIIDHLSTSRNYIPPKGLTACDLCAHITSNDSLYSRANQFAERVMFADVMEILQRVTSTQDSTADSDLGMG